MKVLRHAVVTGCLLLLLANAGMAAGTFEEGRAAFLKKDYAKALAILKPLAEQGDAKAEVTLGIMYDYGYGIGRDGDKAIEWYKKAAMQGIPAVQHDLGVKYYNGAGVKQDYAEAVKWWRMAAENGLPDSQYNLGLMYSRGLGVNKDDAEARKWYEKAAAQGHKQAEYSLAVMYAFGKGTATDFAKAAEWFRKAAEQGMSQAQFNLALLLEKGQGVAKDPQQALEWYQKAADQGLAQARERLAALKSATPEATPPTAATAEAEKISVASTADSASVEASATNGTSTTPLRDESWITAQDPKNYTLQIATGTDERAVNRLLKRDNLGGDRAFFRSEKNGRTRFTAIVGSFTDYQSARTALNNLPSDLQKNNPWIRRFDAIQKLIGQH